MSWLHASAACTPIGDVRRSAQSPDAKVDLQRTTQLDASIRATQVGIGSKVAASPCGSPSARSCGTESPREVLVCRDGSWQVDEPCAEGESCVDDSAEAVHCQAVIAECVNQEAGHVYCDADEKRILCLDAMHSKELPCDTLEHCVMVDGAPKCRCIPGHVNEQGCVPATSCDVQNGGCDTATHCIPTASGRDCSECPSGYQGEGERGCEPQLVMFQASCGALDPPLAPGVYDYRLRAPFVCQQLVLQGSAPAGARVKVFADQLPAQWSWQVTPVKTGETAVPIQVTSEFGVSSKYTLTIERSGGQQAYIKASNADADDCFGFGLAVSDDQLFVGAVREDGNSASDLTNNDAQDSGAVYVFAPKDEGWVQQAYLKADSIRAGEFFGTSIAVAGDTLVIGAPNRDPMYWYAGTAPAARSGAVYVFTRLNGAWTQTARLTPSNGSLGDLFGHRVALDEDTLVVGAPADSSSVTGGAAYVFQREGDEWHEKQKLTPSSPAADSMFGLSVALDADRVLVGAPHDSTLGDLVGAAFMFVRQGGQWQQEQRLVPNSATPQMTFGWQVLVQGDSAMVSAPAVVRVGPPGELVSFERSGGAWTQVSSLAARYPNAADLYSGGLARLGSTLVVGANGDSSGARGLDGDASRADSYQSGAVYLYATSDKDAHAWLASTYLKASTPDPDDLFGETVAANATAVFVAAPFESSASRAINGDANNNNSSHSGAVYVFR